MKLKDRLQAMKAIESEQSSPGAPKPRFESESRGAGVFEASPDQLAHIHSTPKRFGEPARTLVEVGGDRWMHGVVRDSSRVVIALGLGIMVDLDVESEAEEMLADQIAFTSKLIEPLQAVADQHRERVRKIELALAQLKATKDSDSIGEASGSAAGIAAGTMQGGGGVGGLRGQ